MNDFEQRLTDLLDHKAAAADVTTQLDFLHARVGRLAATTRWSTRRVIAFASAAVLVLGGVVLTLTVGRHASRTANGGPGGIAVYYQRVEVTLTADLQCAEQIHEDGTFTSAVIETWSDRVGRRWRSRVTYPDGSTYEWILLGSVRYPTTSADRGEPHGATVGCLSASGERVFGWGLDDARFYSLDLHRELAPNETQGLVPFDQLGTRIDGQTDSQGRPAIVWRQILDSAIQFVGGLEQPVHQLDEWYVDASTPDHLTEHRFEQTVRTYGTVRRGAVLVADGDLTVTGDFFDTTGFTKRGTAGPPDLASPDTTEVAPLTTEPSPADTYTAELTRLGADVQHAPAPATTLGDAHFCGTDDLTYHDGLRNLPAQQCLLDAFHDGRSAVYLVLATTTEGDPIVEVYRTDGGTATMYVDATRDKFGSGTWETVVCPDIGMISTTVGNTQVPQVQCVNGNDQEA